MSIRKILNKISLRFYLFILILLVGAGGCYAVYHFFVFSEKNRIIASVPEKELAAYSQFIYNHYVNHDNSFRQNNSDYSERLYDFAQLYQGRALVCNKQFKVLFDTDGYTGAYFCSNEMIRCSKGKTVTTVDEEHKMISYMLPLKDTEVFGMVLYAFPIEKQIQNFNEIKSHFQIVCISFLIVLLFVDIFICIRISAPLKSVSQSMLRLSDNNSNASISVKGYREAVEISDNANHLITRLNEVEESRQEFVSNVSHELKTPMASMKVLADSLLSQEGLPEEMYREFLTDINSEIDRENAIISDLLTLVKLDSKNVTVHLQKTHVNNLMQVVLNRITPLASEENIEVVFENFRDVYADVDENRLIMAFTNIAQNAVNYNRPGGFIHVSLNSDINYFYVTFEDSGIGIPEESIPHLFERFYRVDKARSRSTGGNGLGLAITYEIIKAHNGEIKVYSQINEGTTFAIRIPLSESVVS